MRTPTAWTSNASKFINQTAYSDPTVSYSSATASYSLATAALDDFNKTAQAWTPITKTPQTWLANVAANANTYTYDMALFTYDMANQNYDGIVVGQDPLNTNSPTAWTAA